LQRNWKETVVASMSYHSGISLARLEENQKNLGRILNLTTEISTQPPKYKAGVLYLELECLIAVIKPQSCFCNNFNVLIHVHYSVHFILCCLMGLQDY
jgi:hypothetical protein